MATILAMTSSVTVALVGLVWKLTDRRISRIEDKSVSSETCNQHIGNLCQKFEALESGQKELMESLHDTQAMMNNFILKVETKFAYWNGVERRKSQDKPHE